jgi:GTP pyrophosphokinase
VACSNLAAIEEDRKLDVTWDAAPDQVFHVKLIVTAGDRKNLLADLTRVIAESGTNIQSGEFAAEDDLATMTFLIEVLSLSALEKVLTAVRRVPSVQRVERFQLR